MRTRFGVFGSDQVNKQNSRISAEAMAHAVEEHAKIYMAQGVPMGTPMHVSHDWHRVVAWATTTGFYLQSNVVYQVGFVSEPVSEEESQALRSVQRRYLDVVNAKQASPYESELRSRLAGFASCSAEVRYCSAAVLIEPGLARKVYPEYFEGDWTDKDGLVDFRILLSRCREIHPGIFHDPRHNLLLIAHHYFRRSLSRANNLNEYFLRVLSKCCAKRSYASFRIRLDPDVLGHPESFRPAIELEYWGGPKFSDDISTIPDGVSIHQANERERFYEGIYQTQLWWKPPELRKQRGTQLGYRTFEAEELTENPSYGLPGETFGCRYIHAEYSIDDNAISHFDGAIRAYEGDQYLTRLDTRIDRAGKRSIYTKLFRIDGALPVEEWKDLSAAFYRGNPLVLEYFGSKGSPAVDTSAGSVQAERAPDDIDWGIQVYVSYAPADALRDQKSISLDHAIDIMGRKVSYVEHDFRPNSALTALINRHVNVKDLVLIGFDDGILNVPRILLGADDSSVVGLSAVLADLEEALGKDEAAGLVKATSIAVGWRWSVFDVTLSIAGRAQLVGDVIRKLKGDVNPALAPSRWIEVVREAVSTSTTGAAQFNPGNLIDMAGILHLKHPRDSSGQVSARIAVPKSHALASLLTNRVPP